MSDRHLVGRESSSYAPLWLRTAINQDARTAPLTYLLALHCSLARSLTHSSKACGNVYGVSKRPGFVPECARPCHMVKSRRQTTAENGFCFESMSCLCSLFPLHPLQIPFPSPFSGFPCLTFSKSFSYLLCLYKSVCPYYGFWNSGISELQSFIQHEYQQTVLVSESSRCFLLYSEKTVQ